MKDFDSIKMHGTAVKKKDTQIVTHTDQRVFFTLLYTLFRQYEGLIGKFDTFLGDIQGKRD
jgi:hypothetical protein